MRRSLNNRSGGSGRSQSHARDRARSRRILKAAQPCFPGGTLPRRSRSAVMPWRAGGDDVRPRLSLVDGAGVSSSGACFGGASSPGVSSDGGAGSSAGLSVRASGRNGFEPPDFLKAAAIFLGLAFGLWATALPGGPLLHTAEAQITWLNFEDGDILNVSSADGPPGGTPFVEVRRSIEESDKRGEFVINRFRLAYGVTDNITLGVAAAHLQQAFDGLHKDGLGDTNLSLKLHYAPYRDLPIRIGLRQSLSLPTGYELEHPELASFTSRENDYSAQLLFQYSTPGFSAYLNPGVLLPGGDANSYFTGGLGLRFGLPLSLDVEGEYYTRWDMVEEEFESEIYGGVKLPLFWSLALHGGMKKRLLQGEEIDPEIHMGLSLGRAQRPHGDLFEIRGPRTGPTGLLVHPIESMPPDPYGVSEELAGLFRTDRSGGEEYLKVYVRTTDEPYPAGRIADRHYELNVKLLEINEGKIGGFELPRVLRAPRARTEVVAQAELIAPDGYSVVRRAVYRGLASSGLGMELLPESGSNAAMVAPDEVRAKLRKEAVENLSLQIIRDVVRSIHQRDS